MTTERAHMSIGEVLSLLQPEYPDITISKIRFLESQGLLDPERTPSGYRKFHDEDIDRLRWILTQQRDHFLPLKVIKERLASGDLGPGTPEGVLPLATDAPPDPAPAPTSVPAAAMADARPRPAASAPTSQAAAKRPDPDHAAPDEAPAQAGDASDTSTTDASDTSTSDASDASTTDASTSDATSEPGATASGKATAAGAEKDPVAVTPPEADQDRARAVASLVESPAEEKAARAAAEQVETTPASPRKSSRRRHPTSQGAAPADGAEGEDATTVTLSLDDLITQSGLTAREITELEHYGLIASQSLGQVNSYDEECLVVARLAAGFSRYGIEPRHLRMYKVAAEREAGLFEQLITPLLKQRRSSAREEAVKTLEDLAELADDLRAAMVRTALRDYLGST